MNKKATLPFFLLVAGVSFPTYADSMQCDAAGNCVLVHTTSSSGSTANYPSGSTNSPPPPSSVNQGPTYAASKAAEAAAAEQGRKLNECYSQKALVPISQTQCKAQANTMLTNYSVTSCHDSGTFFPSFAFNSTYFSFASNYPSTPYTTSAQCQQLTGAAINQFQTDCSTKGDLAVYNTCLAAGIK